MKKIERVLIQIGQATTALNIANGKSSICLIGKFNALILQVSAKKFADIEGGITYEINMINEMGSTVNTICLSSEEVKKFFEWYKDAESEEQET